MYNYWYSVIYFIFKNIELVLPKNILKHLNDLVHINGEDRL